MICIKYRLYTNSNNDISSDIIKNFFRCRGIQDYQRYMHLDSSVDIPYDKLNNMDDGIKLFDRHISNESKIGILVDEDVDGFCSASMMYLYVKKICDDYPVKYILHGKAKAHGISKDVTIPDDIQLLIIPDAGTNDCQQCNDIHEKYGMDILILDHHEKEDVGVEHKYAVVINNQMSPEYKNKDLCGAGVVYKFLQALDDYYWNDYADDFIDLCALANISDNMDVKSFETKYCIEQGLNNIKNKCFKSMITAQDYSMHGHVNMHNIAWYITSIINGCIRFGTKEEKELLFRAFIETDEIFEYKKRATKGKPSEVIQESIYDRAARLCKNAKSRQDKAREKATNLIMDEIDCSDNTDKVIVYDATSKVDTSLSGVVAIKIADIVKRPVILLQKRTNGNRTEYGGSARNIDHSPIESFKDIVNQTEIANGVGHPNAFGIVGLLADQKDIFISKLNDILKNVEYDSTYYCDYIFNAEHLSIPIISSLTSLEDFVGTGINEPIIAITNISLCKRDLQILGKNSDTYKLNINDVELVKFRAKNDDPVLSWYMQASDEDEICFEIVGKPSVNIFNGIKTMQVIIEDTKVIETIVRSNTDDIWESDSSEYDEDEIAW